jgi:hypothetical protein
VDREEQERSEQDPVQVGEEQARRLREIYNDSALERLARSNQAYYSTHGHYVPDLATLLLAERAEREHVERWLRIQLSNAQDMVRAIAVELERSAASARAVSRDLGDAVDALPAEETSASSAGANCPSCGHPRAHHTSGGMCAGEAGGSECYCVRFPDSTEPRETS